MFFALLFSISYINYYCIYVVIAVCVVLLPAIKCGKTRSSVRVHIKKPPLGYLPSYPHHKTVLSMGLLQLPIDPRTLALVVH
jgi:hypothetical protein